VIDTFVKVFVLYKRGKEGDMSEGRSFDSGVHVIFLDSYYGLSEVWWRHHYQRSMKYKFICSSIHNVNDCMYILNNHNEPPCVL
jgi:hypothetical protein